VALTWKVAGQTQTTVPYPGGKYGDGWAIELELSDGGTLTFDVIDAEYDPDHVTAKATFEVANYAKVAGLAGSAG